LEETQKSSSVPSIYSRKNWQLEREYLPKVSPLSKWKMRNASTLTFWGSFHCSSAGYMLFSHRMFTHKSVFLSQF
jgi:hypothetical protein